ncbi:hypothetical protein BDN72DRAFT_879063, partial [Pluteus cervinus]
MSSYPEHPSTLKMDWDDGDGLPLAQPEQSDRTESPENPFPRYSRVCGSIPPILMDIYPGITEEEYEWLASCLQKHMACTGGTGTYQAMKLEEYLLTCHQAAHPDEYVPMRGIDEQQQGVNVLENATPTATPSLEDLIRSVISICAQSGHFAYLVLTTRTQELQDFKFRIQQGLPQRIPSRYPLTISFDTPIGPTFLRHIKKMPNPRTPLLLNDSAPDEQHQILTVDTTGDRRSEGAPELGEDPMMVDEAEILE